MGYPFPKEALLPFEEFQKLPLTQMHVSCLTPTQYVVRIDRMEWLRAGNKPEGNDIPHCVTWRGVTYLYDGHHRWLLARLQGVTWMAVRNLVIEDWTLNPAWVALEDKPHLTIACHPDAFKPLP